MARAPISIQTVDRDGLTASLTTIGVDGVSVSFGDKPYLLVANDSGGPLNLVAKANFTVDGLVMPDYTLAIPDGTTRLLVAPFTNHIYKQADNLLYINGSGLKVAAFK